VSLELTVPPIEACAAAAARLVHEAFVPPTVEMNDSFLRWVLDSRDVDDPAEAPLTVMGSIAAEPVSFVGSPTRRFRVGQSTFPVTIPSWLAISPAAAGKGLARATYGRLLDDIKARHLAVLTYAIEGARSVSFIESMYLERGFDGGILPAMPLHGALRAPHIPSDDTAWSPTEPVLSLDRSASIRSRLMRDPRGAIDLDIGGAIAVTAWQRTADGRRPVLFLEHLPEPLTPRSLASAVAAALRLGANHSRQVLVPNLPESAHELGRLAGLRRLPGTIYRAWIWTPNASHPASKCRLTTHPIL
jgi:hypothetical protein